MKIAICMSGHIRNLKQNFSNFEDKIIKSFNNPDIFLHTWDTYGWRTEGNDIKLGHKEYKGFDYYSGKVNQEEIMELLKPKKYVFENFLDKEQEFFEQAKRYKPNCGHPMDRPENSVSTTYKILKCNELKKEYEQENEFIYDVVIRTRPDVIYLQSILNNQILNLIKNEVLLTPDLESYGTASDIFAMGTSTVIDKYSNIYNELDYINNSGCNMNPHHMWKYYFDHAFPNKWMRCNFPIALNRCRKVCGNGKLVCPSCDPCKKILSNIFEE